MSSNHANPIQINQFIYNADNFQKIQNPLNKTTADALFVRKQGNVSLSQSLNVNGLVNSSQPRWSGYWGNVGGFTQTGYITYNTTHFTASGVDFNTSTGIARITTAGRYLITFCGYSDFSGSAFCEVVLQKNNNLITRNYSERQNNFHKAGMNLYAILDLVLDDTIRIWVNTGGQRLYGAENAYFSGFCIG
jgi:hypothetical protein